MDTFIVSARKYRPQQFDTVIGQSHITTTLKNAIKQNQLAHAFLFCGPRGVGKTTCARILAKTINCETINENGEACNTCNSCVSFNNGSSLNIHELDAASNNSVDDIRTLVEQVRFAPQAGRYKTYIVDEVHMLSSSAFNAFLKTLEEPPPYAIFILATTEKHKILPTILSRCQIFDFKRITTSDIVDHLQQIAIKESIQVEKAALQLIAQKSEGCMRDALSILDKMVSFSNGKVTHVNALEHLNILDHDYYFKLMEGMQQQKIDEILLLYNAIYQKGFEGDHVLNGLSECIRNILICKNMQAITLLDIVEDMQGPYTKAASTFSTSFLVSALNVLNESEIQYKMARNKRLHVEMALIKLCYLQQAIELSINNGEIVKKKRIDQSIIHTKAIEPIELNIQTPGKVYAAASINQSNADVHPIPENRTVGTRENERITIAQNNTMEENLTIKEPIHQYQPNQKERNSVTKKSLLNALKEKHQQPTAGVTTEAKLLTQDALTIAWQQFIQQLKTQSKASAVSNFELAILNIIDHQSFEIISYTAIQQRFIEQERVYLLEHIQKYFNNNQLTFTFKVEKIKEDSPSNIPLSTKEKFTRIVEQYPLVKELKDRLRLELEY